MTQYGFSFSDRQMAEAEAAIEAERQRLEVVQSNLTNAKPGEKNDYEKLRGMAMNGILPDRMLERLSDLEGMYSGFASERDWS